MAVRESNPMPRDLIFIPKCDRKMLTDIFGDRSYHAPATPPKPEKKKLNLSVPEWSRLPELKAKKMILGLPAGPSGIYSRFTQILLFSSCLGCFLEYGVLRCQDRRCGWTRGSISNGLC